MVQGFPSDGSGTTFQRHQSGWLTVSMSDTTGTSPLPAGYSHSNVVIGCDVGKTRCRIQLARPSSSDGFEVLASHLGEGAPGLAADLDATFGKLVAGLEALPGDALGQARAIAVGAAGAQSDPGAAKELADRLAIHLDAQRQNAAGHKIVVAVTTDAVTAHLGALGAIAGTVVIAGTGAVAYHLDEAGELAMADGWGPVIGDVGGGFWFGEQGLQAALAGADHRGPDTSLTAAAADFSPTGELRGLARIVGQGYARAVAAFAEVVLDHAAAGDRVARQIRARAVDGLAATARAVTPAAEVVSVVGGLADNEDFTTELSEALTGAGLQVRPALGSGLIGALDLAAHLAAERPLPHRRQTHLGSGPAH